MRAGQSSIGRKFKVRTVGYAKKASTGYFILFNTGGVIITVSYCIQRGLS
jgi:hypothetical protein